jgi:hypothetical protein
MRTAIAISILGLALSSQDAVAQTAVEQAQIVRDFEQSVLDYTAKHHCLAMFPTAVNAATPAPKIFTLPVALVFRQMISRALVGHAGEPNLFGVGIAHRATVLEPFPGTDLYDFPERLADGLPALPAPLEYRLIFNDLVIRDTQADIIVAVLRDAVGTITTTR